MSPSLGRRRAPSHIEPPASADARFEQRRECLRHLAAATIGTGFGIGGLGLWITPRLATATSALQRIALVIGNASYDVAPLRNPVNDARLMAGTLRHLGYRVRILENATLAVMVSAIRDWVVESRDAESRFLYFAGHGAQFRGRNYLLPIEAELQTEDDVVQKAVNATDVAERLARIPNGVNIVVLDACRNAPFPLTTVAAGARSRAPVGAMAPGLVPALSPQGTIIAFATAPGSVALDGKEGGASVYSRHLAAQMSVPGVPLETVFKRVRTAVARETGNRQVPWETSSLVGEFCLRPTEAGQCSVSVATGQPVDLGRLTR